MTIKDFYEKYSDIEITEEQEKQIKEYLKIKENKRWKPELEERYYFITQGGTIQITCNTDDGDSFRLFTNNCFKTKEEAKFRLEQIKVYNELKNFADENNTDIKDYRFLINIQSGDLNINYYTYMHHIGEIGFSSKELAQQAIEKVGEDRIKKYLFEVE